MAASAILPPNTIIPDVDDSKKLSARKREQLYPEIISTSIATGIGVVRALEIDKINILEATRKAMFRSIQRLKQHADFILIDAVQLHNLTIPSLSIIKGDQRSHSISAASIIAKVIRDRIMDQWHHHFPHYEFNHNKGYGTANHLRALRNFGPTPIHRKSFKGVHDCKMLFDPELHR